MSIAAVVTLSAILLIEGGRIQQDSSTGQFAQGVAFADQVEVRVRAQAIESCWVDETRIQRAIELALEGSGIATNSVPVEFGPSIWHPIYSVTINISYENDGVCVGTIETGVLSVFVNRITAYGTSNPQQTEQRLVEYSQQTGQMLSLVRVGRVFAVGTSVVTNDLNDFLVAQAESQVSAYSLARIRARRQPEYQAWLATEN